MGRLIPLSARSTRYTAKGGGGRPLPGFPLPATFDPYKRRHRRRPRPLKWLSPCRAHVALRSPCATSKLSHESRAVWHFSKSLCLLCRVPMYEILTRAWWWVAKTSGRHVATPATGSVPFAPSLNLDTAAVWHLLSFCASPGWVPMYGILTRAW